MSNFTNPFGSSNRPRRRRASSTQEDPLGGLPNREAFANSLPRGSSSARPPPAPREYRRYPPVAYREPFSQLERRSSSSRRGSSSAALPGPDELFGGPSPFDMGRRGSSSYQRDSYEGFAGSSRYPPAMDLGRRTSSSSRRPSLADAVSPPRLRRRRGAEDLSAHAGSYYDPFVGALRTAADFRRESDGDPALPPYRSASAYAREPGGYPPGYYGGRSGSRDISPPRYSSIGSSSEGYGGAAPRQYPPTRRSSAYDQSGMRPDMDYEVSKRDRR